MPGGFTGLEGCHPSSWRAQTKDQHPRDDRGFEAQGREDWGESFSVTLNVFHWNFIGI